jgi:predicted DCC family thiol-disulfide oxidoreductase YuxK
MARIRVKNSLIVPAILCSMADKVYYNSACPVCNAGIKGQRRRMEACGIADVEWVDIHSTPGAVEEVGAALEEVRERLYVKDANGQLHIGADAFAHLSSRTHCQRWLAMLVQLPVLRQLARLVYNIFARLLYRWNRAKGHW